MFFKYNRIMSVELLGLNIDTYSFNEAVAKARELIDGNAVSQVVTINPEMFEYANKDRDFVIFVNDGPCGLRKPVNQEFTNQEDVYTSVCMPAPSSLAASFDKKLCYYNATILAKECLLHKTNILLAPGVNIKRYVLCGRNFEYFSEDPYLAGILAANYVNGLEDSGVGACVKHYAVNSQEHARTINSSEVSLRALAIDSPGALSSKLKGRSMDTRL